MVHTLGFQLKASYEKALRLPTIEEMFGDEDLEVGDMALKPESSHNVNLNLSYNATFGNNIIYVEAGLIYRDTRDYIQRNIMSLEWGKSAATYVNYGKVETRGNQCLRPLQLLEMAESWRQLLPDECTRQYEECYGKFGCQYCIP